MARLRDRPRQIPTGGPARVSPATEPAARFGRDAVAPDPDDPDDPDDSEEPEDDFDRSERDREVVDDFRLPPVDGVLVVLARGRVRSAADLAASRAGTGADLVAAPALLGAAPPAEGAPLVDFGAVPLAGAAPLEGTGSTAWSAPWSAALAAVAVGAAALGSDPLPFDRTAADSVGSVRGAGVPFELSIAPIVSVGSVKGKHTSVA
jgi:hypothetical protein